MHTGITPLVILSGWRGRWRWLAGAVIASWLAGIIYIVLVTPDYQAAARLFYLENGTVQSGRNGSLAALTSFGLSTAGSSDRQLALAVLNSDRLIEQFIQQEKLLPLLYPNSHDATLLMGVDRFRGMRTISDNTDTGVITVTLTMSRKDMVARLLNSFVALADDDMRRTALKRNSDSLDYLRGQLASSQSEGLRTAIIDLASDDMRQIMLAKNYGPYAFSIVDEAVAPLKAHWPRPLLLLGLLTLLSLLAVAAASMVVDFKHGGAFG